MVRFVSLTCRQRPTMFPNSPPPVGLWRSRSAADSVPRWSGIELVADCEPLSRQGLILHRSGPTSWGLTERHSPCRSASSSSRITAVSSGWKGSGRETEHRSPRVDCGHFDRGHFDGGTGRGTAHGVPVDRAANPSLADLDLPTNGSGPDTPLPLHSQLFSIRTRSGRQPRSVAGRPSCVAPAQPLSSSRVLRLRSGPTATHS